MTKILHTPPPPLSNPLPSMTKCITLFLREFKMRGNALKFGNMKPLLGAVNLETFSNARDVHFVVSAGQLVV